MARAAKMTISIAPSKIVHKINQRTEDRVNIKLLVSKVKKNRSNCERTTKYQINPKMITAMTAIQVGTNLFVRGFVARLAGKFQPTRRMIPTGTKSPIANV